MIKAIVTGPTRGLGAAIAANLLARTFPVLGLARGRNADLQRHYPDTFSQVALDLSDPAALTHWLGGDTLARFLSDCSCILLINNAGTIKPVGPLQSQDPRLICAAVTLNVSAPLMLAGAVVAASGPGCERRILHISSGAARNAYAGWSVYCATKAALDQHARAVELDRTPAVRICSLAPGVIDTDMQAELRASPLEQFPSRAKFDELKRTCSLADPAQSAQRLVEYLLNDAFGREPVADLRNLARNIV